MPNANRPTGFSPVKSLDSPWMGQGNIYSIASGYATALAIGDPIKSTGTSDDRGYPGGELAAPGDGIRGVILGLGRSPGLVPNTSNLDSTVRPAAAPGIWFALVCDDPMAIYEIQAATAAATAVGANADIVAGANNGFVSGVTLSGTSAATAAQCRILGLVDRPDNEFGAFAKLLVRINENELTTLAGI